MTIQKIFHIIFLFVLAVGSEQANLMISNTLGGIIGSPWKT